jgi:hypothetical protein
MNGKQRIYKSGANPKTPDDDWLKQDLRAIYITAASASVIAMMIVATVIVLVVDALK